MTLLDVSPPIWRELRVPSDLTLGSLHRVLQVAFDWEERHLHQWRIGERVFVSPQERSWGELLEDESEAVLVELAPPGSAFHYDYDLGDGWEHLVEVVRVEPLPSASAPLEILDGYRSAPPEDCGGPQGYEHLLDVLGDPEHPEHQDVVACMETVFDPDGFDIHATNLRLQNLWRH